MSAESSKSTADRLRDTLAQLKEMRHYAKNNVEVLTAEWLVFDGELSKLKKADAIADLMDRQGQLHDALQAMIEDLEGVLDKLPPEEPPA
ncbi:hypothetical protein GCM10027285_24580 [Oleiagrimonas citrea]|uniref:Uncharacterized protein n=1 Tax=Oleiagrimonas citrea TaxID=1665687 RepID=A0A846ZMY4_9GAMM|nr:hypothetical protein [Oleiagrimonas citrea]NKZ38801.1 hypothetical protein [Oleiagrimonas citrea]